jgi:hypothetical protein
MLRSAALCVVIIDPETIEAGNQSSMNWTGKRRRPGRMPGKRVGKQSMQPMMVKTLYLLCSFAALAANQPLG